VHNHYSDAERAYEEAVDFLINALSKFDKASIPRYEDDTNSSFLEATKPSSSQLSRIGLPKFSGVMSEWEGFLNTFKSMIDSNPGLTNTLKFHYLQSCVSGAAAKLIVNLAPSDDSYLTAWKALMNEYEDKRALIRTHIASILRFPSMKTENIVELKRLRER